MYPGNSLLFNLKSGFLEIAEKILEAYADYPSNERKNYVNSTNSDDGFSALQYAVSNCQPSYKVIELLLTYEADVDATNSVTGFSILHSAILNSAGKEVIGLLLTHGANVNKRNHNRTPLLYALSSFVLDYEVIELLLEHGADIHTTDLYEDVALLCAVKHPNVTYKLLELLLKYKPYVNDITLSDGLSVLQNAVKNPNSNPKMIELLLVSGANVHYVNRQDGCRTALHYAIQKSTLIYEEFELLLRFASDANASKKFPNVHVLLYAISHSIVNYKVIELLLKYVADVYRDCILTHIIEKPNINPKLIQLLWTASKRKVSSLELFSKNTNLGAAKVVVRLETCNFNHLTYGLELWKSKEDAARRKKICFEILKWLVWQRLKEFPKSETVNSVLGNKYMELISRFKFSPVLIAFVKKCIRDITSLKVNGFTSLLFPKVTVKEMSSIDTRTVANRLLNIWSTKNPSIYSDIIESNIESEDLLGCLLEFQITRWTSEGTEKMLGYLPTLRIVDYLPLRDMLNLLRAYYGFTLEKPKVKTCLPSRVKLPRTCKKQRLN